jgi:CRISPR/Cas system CMR-associated protein Cmr3 (group 5 of RAMP superfamily)
MSKEEIHDLASAIVFVCSEAQYLKFEMVEYVQNWRQKWFYIKDRNSSKSDQY